MGALLCPLDLAVTVAALCAQIRVFLFSRSAYNPNFRPSKRLSFLQIGADRYFDHKGCATGLMIWRGPRSRAAVKQRRNEAIRTGEGLT